MSAEAKRLDSVHFWKQEKSVFAGIIYVLKIAAKRMMMSSVSEEEVGFTPHFFSWKSMQRLRAAFLALGRQFGFCGFKPAAEAWTTAVRKWTSWNIQMRVRKTNPMSLWSPVFLFDSSSAGDLRFAVETACSSTHSINITAEKPAGAGCLHGRELCALYQIL